MNRKYLLILIWTILVADILIVGCSTQSELTPGPSTSAPTQEPQTAPVSESAIYKVEFVADWSEETHPGDYPRGAHFSPFVAYSHNDSVDSLVFIKGQTPTPGIEQMAETGGTTILDREIDEFIGLNLAFKRTRGGLFNSPGIDSAELELHKDYSHITFVSMIAPSPDWFVSQTTNLLQAGEWIEVIELPLITYDAGSDSGEMFTSRDIDTQPKEPINVFADNLQFLGTLFLTRVK